MLTKNEIQLLFALLQNEAINLKYASSISGYDAKYPGDLIEGIEQETGIFINCIEIEGIDDDGKPITTHALMLQDHRKAAETVFKEIKHHFSEYGSDGSISCIDLIELTSSATNTLQAGGQSC